MLQCVAVCCSVLQCFVVFCSLLQCQDDARRDSFEKHVRCVYLCLRAYGCACMCLYVCVVYLCLCMCSCVHVCIYACVTREIVLACNMRFKKNCVTKIVEVFDNCVRV